MFEGIFFLRFLILVANCGDKAAVYATLWVPSLPHPPAYHLLIDYSDCTFSTFPPFQSFTRCESCNYGTPHLVCGLSLVPDMITTAGQEGGRTWMVVASPKMLGSN